MTTQISKLQIDLIDKTLRSFYSYPMTELSDQSQPQQDISTHPQEAQQPAETDPRIRQIVDEVRAALVQDQNDPERETRLLKAMDMMEAAKGELGLSCETIGEGKNRAIAMRQPVVDRLEEPALVKTWVTEYGYPREKFLPMGTMRTTRKQYMVLNRSGVTKVAITSDQQLDVDPNAAYFSARHDFTPDKARDWTISASGSVRWFAERGQSRYLRLLDGHQFPAHPTTPDYTRDHTERLRRNAEHSQKGDDWKLGSYIEPEGTFAQFIMLDDRTYDHPGERTNPGQNWFDTWEYALVRVTKPEFVENAVRSNMANKIPNIDSTPQQPSV